LSRSIQAQANEKQKINLMDKFRYEGIKLAWDGNFQQHANELHIPWVELGNY
jgi:hypothetical protein